MARLLCAVIGHPEVEFVPFYMAHRCKRCLLPVDDEHVGLDAIKSTTRKERLRRDA